MQKNKWIHWFIIGTFISLYLGVSVISTIHVIDFFKLSNPSWLAISLAIAFEIGAAASLASLIVLDKMNRTIVWLLFFALTFMQAMGNTYYAYINLEGYDGWIELFGLMEEEPIAQKRILALISGAILPLIALGFIKSLVDYIKPQSSQPEPEQIPEPEEVIEDLEDKKKLESEIIPEEEPKNPYSSPVNWDEIEEDLSHGDEDHPEDEEEVFIPGLLDDDSDSDAGESDYDPNAPLDFVTKKPIRIKEKGRGSEISDYRKDEIAKRETKAQENKKAPGDK